MRAAKVQASLRIRAVSPGPSLLAHTSSESRGTFRQKTRSLAPLNGWACAVKICHDGMLEDTNSLDGAHLIYMYTCRFLTCDWKALTLIRGINSANSDHFCLWCYCRKSQICDFSSKYMRFKKDFYLFQSNYFKDLKIVVNIYAYIQI